MMMTAYLLLAIALQSSAPAAVEPLGRFEMGYPTPSPDGVSVAFQGNFDGRSQLYAIDVATGKIRRLHVSTHDDTHPAWSPDGTRLAFISNRDGNDEVYVLDLSSGTARSVAPHPGKDGHPKWSGDGQWLVFNRTFDPNDKGGDTDSAILRVRADGSGVETISDTPRVETFASLSPDGRSAALIEWFPNAAGEINRNGEIVIVDLATGARRNITNSDSFDGHPYWSRSGRWIYFSAVVEGPKGREFAVHRIRPNGEGLERLTAVDGVSEARGMPSDDERWLYFNTTRDGQTIIMRQALPPG
jgi:Tol biopolymer transport system component